MPAKIVFIDTSAWIEYLNKTSHPVVAEVEDALLLNTAVTCQLVLAELLQGAKSEREIELIKDLASIVKIVDESVYTWQNTGLLANKLRKHGKTLSLVDCYLAVLAKENKADILTLDKHFAVIADYLK